MNTAIKGQSLCEKLDLLQGIVYTAKYYRGWEVIIASVNWLFTVYKADSELPLPLFWGALWTKLIPVAFALQL